MGTPLQVPAMRGAMGDWIYYVTLLPLTEVASRIKRTEEIHSSRLLRQMIQRALTPRSKDIAEYLKSQEQRFFNAIVVGVYGGEPEWHQLTVKKSEFFDPTDLEGRVANCLGILTLRGDEKLFAIDGQHRVEGIKTFTQQLESERTQDLEDEVSAIFVAHSNTPTGLQRTRRLFATLNRYAKPVSLTEIIALDEDDVVAITCRDLLENHPLFKDGRVSLKKGKSVAPTDDMSITSLPALYQAMDIYLMDGTRAKWNRFKTNRPADELLLARFVSRGHELWNKLLKSVSELREVQSLRADESLPKRFRNTSGGDLLFRPIAFPMFAKCLRRAQSFGMDEDTFIERFSVVPRTLNKPPWLGVLWDGTNMIVGEKNQSVAEGLMLWMTNCDPNEKRYKADELRRRLAEVLNKPVDEVTLPRKFSD
ncbi:MAG: DGQHR domain-containing protein [Verrucomicrobia bacterium]|nr:DGQHR domain-containing protein [Verrucomicrobiota bacterium]